MFQIWLSKIPIIFQQNPYLKSENPILSHLTELMYLNNPRPFNYIKLKKLGIKANGGGRTSKSVPDCIIERE